MRAIGTVAWRTLLAVDRLIRLHFIDFSGLLPLLGATTVRRQLRVSEILALLGVATCFHVFAYVLNDVVDLPIDRTQPLRQADPLVRGAIRRWQALTIALAAIPLTLPLTHWLGGGGTAHSTLLAGFAAMTAYNLWGKRGRVPPMTDAVQGVAWGSLAVYGAYAIGGEPSMLTWVVAAYAAGFILLINGIHGGLRDLNNDFARGARTTAIFFGTRPGAAGGAPRVPAGVPIFAYAVSVSLTILSMLPLFSNAFGYSAGVRLAMLVIIGALNVVALTMLWTVVRPRAGNFWEMAFRVQMLTVVLILPATFAPYVSVAIRWTVVLLVTVSLLPLEWTYRTLHLLVLRVIRRPGTLSDPDAPLAPSFATRDGRHRLAPRRPVSPMTASPAMARPAVEAPDPQQRATKALLAFARPDPVRSIWQLASTLAAFVVLWWIALRALDYSYALVLLVAAGATAMLTRLFIVQHDCGHGAFFRSRKANNIVGVALGVMTLTPYRYWSRQHAMHHAGSGNLDERGFGDITTLTVREYLALNWWGRLRYRVYRNPVVLLGIGPAYLFFLKHRFPFDLPWKKWQREWRSVMLTNVAIALTVLMMAWMVGLDRFLLVQLPINLMAASLGLWLFYVQHQFEETYWEPGSSWSYDQAGLHGSSYLDLPRFLHWCTGNIGYHHLHHLCPRIPNYRLPRCFEELPELAPKTRLTIWDGIRCLKLRFWDEDSGRLIGFRELRRIRRMSA